MNTRYIEVGIFIDWRYRKSCINIDKCKEVIENKISELTITADDSIYPIIAKNNEIRLEIRSDGAFFISQEVDSKNLTVDCIYELFIKEICIAKTLSLEFSGLLYSGDICLYFNTDITEEFYERAKRIVVDFANYTFEIFDIDLLSKYDHHLSFIIRPSTFVIRELDRRVIE